MLARSALHWSHKALGLTLAIGLMLQAVSGAALVFREDLLIALNQRILTSPPPVTLPAVDRVLQAIDDRFGRPVVERVVFPRGERTAAMVYLPAGGFAGRRVIASDPATGVVLGELAGAGLLPFVLFRLHDELLIGTAGHVFLLLEGVALLYLVAVGVMLARPRMRGALRVRWRGSRLQRSFDLHRAAGLSFATFVAFSALTGVILQADFLAASAPAPAHTRRGGTNWSVLMPQLDRLSRDYPRQAIEDIRISSDARTATILVYASGVARPLALDRVNVDLRTGEAEPLQRAADEALARGLLGWMYPLHTGKALGGAGLIFALVSALGLLCMPVLGFLLWRAKPRSKALRAAESMAGNR